MRSKPHNLFSECFQVATGSGRYDLQATVQVIGPDLLIAIQGGEKPHIGALAVSQPRPSLKNQEISSASTSVFCFLGHKEDQAAKAVAEILAATLHTPVVVTAGMHWDGLSPKGIQIVIKKTRVLLQMILERIGHERTAR